MGADLTPILTIRIEIIDGVKDRFLDQEVMSISADDIISFHGWVYQILENAFKYIIVIDS